MKIQLIYLHARLHDFVLHLNEFEHKWLMKRLERDIGKSFSNTNKHQTPIGEIYTITKHDIYIFAYDPRARLLMTPIIFDKVSMNSLPDFIRVIKFYQPTFLYERLICTQKYERDDFQHLYQSKTCNETMNDRTVELLTCLQQLKPLAEYSFPQPAVNQVNELNDLVIQSTMVTNGGILTENGYKSYIERESQQREDLLINDGLCTSGAKLTLGFLNMIKYDEQTFDEAQDVIEVHPSGLLSS